MKQTKTLLTIGILSLLAVLLFTGCTDKCTEEYGKDFCKALKEYNNNPTEENSDEVLLEYYRYYSREFCVPLDIPRNDCIILAVNKISSMGEAQ